MGIIAALVIGAIAGWLAGLIVRGAGFGLIGNIVIGIIGALVASWLLPQLGVSLGGSAYPRHRQRHHRRGDHPGHPVVHQTRLTNLLSLHCDRRTGGRLLFRPELGSRTNNKATR